MPKDLKKLASINKALADIANGMSVRDAADQCGCTVTTMYTHMQKKNVVKPKVPLDTLSDADEERLGNWYVYCHYMGYFQKAVSNLHKEASYLGQSYVSKRRFDQEWCKQFPQRIPYVQTSVVLYDNYSRICAIENKCLGTLLIYCRNRSLFHCFENPRYLYYLMHLDIADHMKLMVAYSADGKTAQPLVINSNLSKRNEFEELALPLNWIKYNWQEVSNSKNQEIPLTYYVEKVLRTHLILQNTNKPILLFHKYIFQPISLAFYETCTQNKVYPVNAQMQRSAFKFHLSLQMETSFRMGSAENQQMSSCVDLIKEILEVKLTKERMGESFTEFGIYPLTLDESIIEKLPLLQMRSIVDTASTAQKKTMQDNRAIERRINKTTQLAAVKTPTTVRTLGKSSYPLTLDESVIEKLPLLQMRSIVDSASTAQKKAMQDNRAIERRLNKTTQLAAVKTPTTVRTIGKTSQVPVNYCEKLESPKTSAAVQKRALNEPSKAVASKVMRMVIPPAKRKPPSSVVPGTKDKVVIAPNTLIYKVDNLPTEEKDPLYGT